MKPFKYGICIIYLQFIGISERIQAKSQQEEKIYQYSGGFSVAEGIKGQ
jgi:hypothetical protein